MILNGLSNFIASIQYYLLDALSGAVSSIIALLRNIVFSLFKKEIPFIVLIGYYIIAIIAIIPTIDKMSSAIPLFNIMAYGYGIYQPNVKLLKIIIIVVSITGIIYDLISLAFADLVNQSLSLTSAVIGYISYCEKVEEKIINV